MPNDILVEHFMILKVVRLMMSIFQEMVKKLKCVCMQACPCLVKP